MEYLFAMYMSKLALLPAMLAPAFVLFAYFAIILDRRRDNSPSKDDTQVGIKLAVLGLSLSAVGLVAAGVNGLLAFVLGGFKGGAQPIKDAIPALVTGAGVAFGLFTIILPRTNNATARQPERLMLGLMSVTYGFMAIIMSYLFIDALFKSDAWMMTSTYLATMLVTGAVGFLSLNRLGSASGWTQPIRPAAPMAPPGYPPQQGGGYPPQQGGGYPPPQGGGYPPPQGGGYPPQQGGGGGYPPR
jgi:hypothetical protein